MTTEFDEWLERHDFEDRLTDELGDILQDETIEEIHRDGLDLQ